MSEIQHLVVMGVSGSGKTTVARILADRLGWPFAEADDHHPQANVAKMAAGTPLVDEDRWPWLRLMRDWLSEQAAEGRSTVITCSALKEVYRDVLREADGRVRFVHLAAAPEVIGDRLQHRSGHFMPPSLLPSQLSTLEPLSEREDGVSLTVDVPPEEVADAALHGLGLDTVARA